MTTTQADAAPTPITVDTFDPESTHPAELQRAGWQAILDNFRRYVEHDAERGGAARAG